MNVVRPRGDVVSAYELVGELTGGAALLMTGVSLHPKVRDRLDRRRNRRFDLDGRPPRFGKDENGNRIVVEKGRPPLAAVVHDIAEKVDQIAGQLTRNGGTSLADAVHRMERNQDAQHTENRASIRRAETLAGNAAVAASQADQRVRQLAGEIEVMTNAALVDHAHLWSALSEMGYERRGEPDAQ